MTTKITTKAHKLGANQKEPAKKTKKVAKNFSQSKDIHEDRGQRQAQTARNRQTLTPSNRGR
jgi:hypothetical protein